MNPPGGREHAKFSRKLHEIERIWTPRGGVRPSRPPLDPPMLSEAQLAGKPTVWYPWLTAAAPYMHLPPFADSKLSSIVGSFYI